MTSSVDKKTIIKPRLADRRAKLIMVLSAESYNNQDIADIFSFRLTRFQVRNIIKREEGGND